MATKKGQETKEERKLRVYNAYHDMREVMTQKYPEFNDRTLVMFLDDSQKRANGYVQSREAQGKEEWQANVFTQFTRNKIKAHIASVAKDVPRVSINAVNDTNQVSFMRGQVMRDLVRASFTEKGANPEKVILLDSWNNAINGTVIKYDGYLKKVQKQQEILSFDPITGKVELGEEREVVVEDKPIELDVPVQNLFIRNAYIRDIQQQPDIIWFSTYSNKESFMAEWGKYKDADKVEEARGLNRDDIETFFGEKVLDITGSRQGKIDVLRYYNKDRNEYMVYANGVELIAAPMLLGRNKKYYPFSVAVFESFANSNFFWGNSLPNILMADQDVANSFLNSMIDKTHRSLNQQLLIDVNNRDAFALEDEFVTGDTKIYVNNIEGVKPMPIAAVSAAEFNMLNQVTRGIDLASTDALQQGVTGTGVTAREIVISNERADEIKGLFYTQMRDLWIQKHVLRVQNILLHYSDMKKVEKIVGEKKTVVFKNQFNLDNTTLSDGTRGMLQIGVFPNRKALPSSREIDSEEMSARMSGKNVEIVNITSDYLDEWEYDIQIESEVFRQKNRALDMALANEKIQVVSTAFPEIFQANKEEFFRDYMTRHDDDPERYLSKMQEQKVEMPEGMPGAPEAAGAGQMPGGLASQLTQPSQSLPQLAGMGQ